MIYATIFEFLGHFHPLLVHLPIGILLLGIGFDLLSTRSRFEYLQPVLPVIYGLGTLSAWLSCGSGYLLSLEGDYAWNALQQHQWAGIVTACLATVTWFLAARSIGASQFVKGRRMAGGVLFLGISISGHLGGSLTHGENYLFETASPKKAMLAVPIGNVQEAPVYAAIIAPIFANKCESCHGAGKQKGKLRMDGLEYLGKGGKSKKPLFLSPAHADEGILIKRISLPNEEDLHMPPKQKPQLNTDEKALLAWWIKDGASFEKKVKDLPQTDDIKKILDRLQNAGKTQEATAAADPFAGIDAPAPDQAAIQALNAKKILVLPVSQGSHLLDANFVNAGKITPALLQLLEPVRQQLVWVRLSDADLDDAALQTIGQLPNLTKLYLDHTAVSDKGLQHLARLKRLQYLNLSGCRISASGLLLLKALPKLNQVFLFGCPIGKTDWQGLQAGFPHAKLDSGGYKLENLVSDTALVKVPVM
jgi:uncharacterized membrane protein